MIIIHWKKHVLIIKHAMIIIYRKTCRFDNNEWKKHTLTVTGSSSRCADGMQLAALLWKDSQCLLCCSGNEVQENDEKQMELKKQTLMSWHGNKWKDSFVF